MRPAILTALLLLAAACGPSELEPAADGFLNQESQVDDPIRDRIAELVDSDLRYPFSQVLDVDLAVSHDEADVSFKNLTGDPVFHPGYGEYTVGDDFQIHVHRKFEAKDITHVAVTFEDQPAEDMDLLVMWLQTGQTNFSMGAAKKSEARDRFGNTIIVRVSDSERWDGPIVRMRLDVGHEAGTLKLDSVRGFHVEDVFVIAPDDDRYHTGQVSLRNQRRNASYFSTRHPLEQTVRLTEPTQFSFTYATHPESPRPDRVARVRVKVRSGGRTEEVGVFRIDPPDTDRWGGALVDLSEYSGEVDLIIEGGPRKPDEIPLLMVAGRPRLSPIEPDSRPNLLVISIDTLRHDHLEAYGYDRSISPVISSLAARGTTFLNCVASAPTTLPSHGTMFTGLRSIRNDVATEFLPGDNATLAELLRDAGYQTAAVTGGAFFDPVFGLDQGFQDYAFAGLDDNPLAFEYNDIELNVELATRWLDHNATKPFFLFFHTYEVHSPYDPREPHCYDYGTEIDPEFTYVARSNNRGLPLQEGDAAAWDEYTWIRPRKTDDRQGGYSTYGADITKHLVDSYDSEIKITDDLLRALFEALERKGVLDNTIIVLTSDHGEAFGEHGRLEHGHLYDTVLKVPFIVAGPGIQAGKAITETIGLPDLVPTVLDLLDRPIPEGLDGVSLAATLTNGAEPAARDQVAFSRVAGISVRAANGEKYNVQLRAGHVMAGHRELFSRDDESEENNLIDQIDAGHQAELDRLILQSVTDLPGIHLRFHAGEPFRFEGTLTTEGFARALASHVRAYPISPSTFTIDSGVRALVSTEPSPDWWLHFDPAFAKVTFEGTFHTADGSVPVNETLDLAPLSDTPNTWKFGAVSLLGTWVYPYSERGAEGEAPVVSPETVEQLRALGYVD